MFVTVNTRTTQTILAYKLVIICASQNSHRYFAVERMQAALYQNGKNRRARLSEIRAGATFRDSTQHREGVQEHNK